MDLHYIFIAYFDHDITGSTVVTIMSTSANPHTPITDAEKQQWQQNANKYQDRNGSSTGKIILVAAFHYLIIP